MSHRSAPSPASVETISFISVPVCAFVNGMCLCVLPIDWFYLLKARCLVLNLIGQEDEHAEVFPFIRHLKDLSKHSIFYFESNHQIVKGMELCLTCINLLFFLTIIMYITWQLNSVMEVIRNVLFSCIIFTDLESF